MYARVAIMNQMRKKREDSGQTKFAVRRDTERHVHYSNNSAKLRQVGDTYFEIQIEYRLNIDRLDRNEE